MTISFHVCDRLGFSQFFGTIEILVVHLFSIVGSAYTQKSVIITLCAAIDWVLSLSASEVKY